MKRPAWPRRALVVAVGLLAAAPLRAEPPAVTAPATTATGTTEKAIEKASAQAIDTCALLTAAQVNELLTGKAVGKRSGRACTWTTTLNPRGLVVAALEETGPAAHDAYAAARAAAGKDARATVSDEAGLGDRAFAARTRFGVVLFMLKGDRLLQLQYWASGPGTAKELAALRPVAVKAVASF